MSNYFEVGTIVNTHGIKGAVKIKPMTDDIKRFELLETILIQGRSGKNVEYHINKVQYVKNMVVLTLDEVTDMNQAIELKNSLVLIPKTEALPLKKDEYYISDLYGMDVYTEEEELLGTIDDIIFTGANEVYVVKGNKNVMIPAIKECIKHVDLDENKMTVHLLEGLLDL